MSTSGMIGLSYINRNWLPDFLGSALRIRVTAELSLKDVFFAEPLLLEKETAVTREPGIPSATETIPLRNWYQDGVRVGIGIVWK